MARAPRRGTRAFLRQVADELPSHLPPKLRAFQAEQWGRFYKVWYAERKIHFEVQFVSGGRLQIGLHLEADAATNERVAKELERNKGAISSALGDAASFGSHGSGWRSIAETWSGGDIRGEEAATEAASRLAEYEAALQPQLERAVGPAAPSSSTKSR